MLRFIEKKKAALNKFQNKYPRHTLLQTSVNNWKLKITGGDELQKQKKGIVNILLLDFSFFCIK